MSANARYSNSLAALVAIVFVFPATTHADLGPGVISDFQDGTVQGWGGGSVVNVPNGGPLGAGDHALDLSNGGLGGNFTMHNIGVNGVIDPAITAITVDLMRPVGQGALELRLVLLGPGGGPFNPPADEWTSTNFISIPDDGVWHNFEFSILEADLTHVGPGTGTYQQIITGLDRLMFRHDPGPPTAGGTPAVGTLRFDNITAIAPEDPVLPDSFKLADGVLVSGQLSDLLASDDMYFAVDPSPTKNLLKQRIDLIVQTSSPTMNPSSFTFRVESAMTGGPPGDVIQTVELFNYLTNTRELVDSRPVQNTDESAEIAPGGDLSRFVNQLNGEITAIVIWKSESFAGGQFTWSIDVDETVWLISE